MKERGMCHVIECNIVSYFHVAQYNVIITQKALQTWTYLPTNKRSD